VEGSKLKIRKGKMTRSALVVMAGGKESATRVLTKGTDGHTWWVYLLQIKRAPSGGVKRLVGWGGRGCNLAMGTLQE